MTRKWSMALRYLKMHPHTKFEIPIPINIADMLRPDHSRNEVRGQNQCHSDLAIICHTPPPQDARMTPTSNKIEDMLRITIILETS